MPKYPFYFIAGIRNTSLGLKKKKKYKFRFNKQKKTTATQQLLNL